VVWLIVYLFGRVALSVAPIVETDDLLDYFALITDRDGERVLMVAGQDDTWSLPRWKGKFHVPWEMVDHVNRQVMKSWGLKVTTLRCLCNRVWQEQQRLCRIYEMETHGSSGVRPPDGCRWVCQEDLESIKIPEPGHSLLLHSWYAEGNLTSVEANVDTPWRRSGWLAIAVSWALDQLKRHRISLLGSMEQVRVSHKSVLLRVPTSEGEVFFRAARRPLDINERLLDWELRPHFSEFIPGHIASDPRRGWSLARTVGSCLQINELEMECLAELDEAVAALAVFQQNTARHVPTFLELGLPDRTVDKLANVIMPMIDEAATRRGVLSREEVRIMRERIPRFMDACQKLASVQLPAVLEHGDFSPGAVPSFPGFMFPDWSEPSVTHPFFRMAYPIISGKNTSLAVQNRARERYLAAWGAYHTSARLREAFDLACILAPLHYASAFYFIDPASAETQWEVDGGLAYYLRKMIYMPGLA